MSAPGRPQPAPKFATAARRTLGDGRLRRDLRATTATMRERRATAMGEPADWERLRAAGRAIREHALLNLDRYLEELERAVTAAGGTVHWARDAAEANRIVTALVAATGVTETVLAGSAVPREIGLAEALADRGITTHETGFAGLVADLDGDRRSHPPFGAVYRGRAEIGELFARELPGVPAGPAGDPAALVAAARAHLRGRLLNAKVAITGADFMVAETGALVMLESEGNARMCLTLPETLITVAGIDSAVPGWADLEVLLQLLPPSSIGERMHPCVSIWTGVSPGDGPREAHLVLVDNGRTKALADEVGRTALCCIRCAACLDVCPVYERAGAQAYGPGYPGPIGAVLTPQLRGVERPADASLPYASTLCGACAEVCPVQIDIPGILVHLRGQVVESRRRRPVPTPEMVMMRSIAWTMAEPRRYEAALQQGGRWARLLARGGRIRRLPGLLGKWTETRDLQVPPKDGFRTWWRDR